MMAGKIHKKLISLALESSELVKSDTSHTCPLCNRTIPVTERDAHHWVPKTKGGRETSFLHRICHQQIHALFTENELAKHFNSADSLLSHPEIQSFVAWVKTKPNQFSERVRKSQRLRQK